MLTKRAAISKKVATQQPKLNLNIMNKHKVKHHRNSDTKTANRDHIRTTALERSVMNYWGGGDLTSFTRETSPSVTDVVQTFSWLFGSHDHPLKPWTNKNMFKHQFYCMLAKNSSYELACMLEIMLLAESGVTLVD